MRTLRVMTLVLLVTWLATAGAASAEDIKNMSGYVDLEWIDIPDESMEIHDIDLSVVLLGIASDARKAGDAELAEALSMVKSIRVKSFSLENTNSREIGRAVKRVTDQLKDEGWSRLIYSKSRDEMVTVNILRVDDEMVGMTLVIYAPEENVAFINVVGTLDLGTLFRLAKEIDTEELDEYFDKWEGYEDR